MVKIFFSPELSENDIHLSLMTWEINGLRLLSENYDFTPRILSIIDQITHNHSLDSIKSNPVIQALRQFYWKKLKVDPTKTRPSSEALVRRVLQKKALPKISPFVDAYNWASAATLIPMGAYDLEKVKTPLELRFSQEGESFIPIGKSEKILKQGILVLADTAGKIISQFPYRDSQNSKITPETRSVLLIACGVDGISQEILKNALAMTKENLEWFRQRDLIEYKDGEFNFFTSS